MTGSATVVPIRKPGSSRTLVLMYHAVHPTLDLWKTQKAAGRWYAVIASQFEAQMEYVAREGYVPCCCMNS